MMIDKDQAGAIPDNNLPKLKLKRILIERGISYERLSAMIESKYPGYVLGISRISRYCTGTNSNVHLSVAIKMAKTLGVTLDDIVDEMD